MVIAGLRFCGYVLLLDCSGVVSFVVRCCGCGVLGCLVWYWLLCIGLVWFVCGLVVVVIAGCAVLF